MRPLTRQQIREVDRRAIEEFGIASLVLMENAGRNAAQLIIEHLQHPGRPRVCILCGSGNNGGDGFVIARHLFNARFAVDVVRPAPAARLTPDARINHDIACRMGIPIHEGDPRQTERLLKRSGVVVDALLGTGFSGTVRPPIDQMIALINAAAHAMVVAMDIPSGLDCDSGVPAEPTVRADLTVTCVAPKLGFARAAAYTGEVCVADIGAPRSLWDLP